MNEIITAKMVFDVEMQALTKVRDHLDDTFKQILEAIVACKGKIAITGIGKSGHVARKIAASMSSLGTCAFFLHPSEAMHGDLGMVQKQDLVIAISYSGESSEIIGILPNIRKIGATIIGITCNPNSTLAKSSAYVQVFPAFKEACLLGLAPTSSTTAVMVYGDALAVAASEMKGFTKRDFGAFHPAGSLGKKLVIRVSDLMKPVARQSVLRETSLLKDAVVEMCQTGFGILAVVNGARELSGIVTDGIISREIQKGIDIYHTSIASLVNRKAVYVNSDEMAIDALEIMIKNNIASMPVVNEDRVIGMIQKDAITEMGIYL